MVDTKAWNQAAESFFSNVPENFRMMTNDVPGHRRICKFVCHPLSSCKRAIVMFPDGTTENLEINSQVTFESFRWIKHVA